jgi:hypothetical protein
MTARLQLFAFRLRHHARVKLPEAGFEGIVMVIQILPGVAQRNQPWASADFFPLD